MEFERESRKDSRLVVVLGLDPAYEFVGKQRAILTKPVAPQRTELPCVILSPLATSPSPSYFFNYL